MSIARINASSQSSVGKNITIGQCGRRKPVRSLFAAVFSSFVASTPLIAQTIPGTVDPGQIRKQFEAPPVPRVDKEVPVPTIAEEIPPPQADSIRLTLQGINLEGATVYAESDIEPLYRDLLNNEISLIQVYDLANKITTKYRNDGYILAQVIVPPQRIEDGRVRLRVVEGFIDKVTFAGPLSDKSDLLQAYARKIEAARPLTSVVLERYLLLINDLAGWIARGTLVPSTSQPGASDLTVVLTHKNTDFYIGADNRGSELLGPARGELRFDLNSAMGLYEHTGFRYLRALDGDELSFYQISHEQQLGTEGRKLKLTLDKVDANPVGAQLANIESHSTSVNLTYTDPVIRSRIQNLYLNATLSYYDGESDFPAAPASNSEEKVRALRLSAVYDRVDRFRGVNILDMSVSQGLDVFDATDKGDPGVTRANARADFTKVNLYAARLQALADRWSVLLALSGQYGFDDVPSSEEFSIGGEQFGKGYDAGEVSGGAGLAGKLELRYAGITGGDLLKEYTIYGSYDGGKVWDQAPGSQEDSVRSVGLGVRFTLANGFGGYVEVDKPLDQDVFAEGNDDARLFAGISFQY